MPDSRKANASHRNTLLAALPVGDLQRLSPNLQPVAVPPGEVLYEPGERPSDVYFPTGSVISLLYTTVDGSAVEVGVVGSDGVLGVALFLGGSATPNRAVVQVAGGALRMPARAAQQEFARGAALHRLLLLYTQAFLTQVSQTAVCNGRHSLEKRLCRWLLMIRDRTHSDELVTTHELLSDMLGVRRESVSLAAEQLQRTGLIQHARGRIRILDRDGLEATVCECYQVVEEEYDRLLGKGPRDETAGRRGRPAKRLGLRKAA